MFVYLFRIYKINGIVAAIQTVEFNDQFDQKFRTIRIDNFKDYYKKICDDGFEDRCDFKVGEDYSLIYNHHAREINVPDISLLPEESVITLDRMESLYDLLRDLANNDCCYVLDELKLTNGGLGVLPSFRNIVVSESTMTLGINVRGEDGNWFFKPIIKIDEETEALAQHEFTVAIKSDKVEKFSKYNLVFKQKLKYNNVDYCIFNYKCDLPICSSAKNSALSFCEPLIVHYSYLNNLYKLTISALKRFQEDYLKFDVPCDKVAKPAKQNLVSRQGVFFILQGKKGKVRDNAYEIIDIAKELSDKVSNISSVGVKKFLEDRGLNKDYRLPIETMIRVLRTPSKFEMVEMCSNFLRDFRLLSLNFSLYLYNTRVTCIYTPEVLVNYQEYVEFPVEGSVFNRSVKVKII